MNHKNERIGEWAAIGHMVLDGFWPVGAAYGVRFLPSTELLGLATFISGFFFLFVTLKKKELHHLFSWKVFFGCAIYTFCLLAPYTAIFYAARTSSAINVSLFTQSEVVFAAVIGWLFFKEQVRGYRLYGLLCIVVANLIVLYNGDLVLHWADLILLLAPSVFVLGNAQAKRLQINGLGYSPLLLFRGFVGGAVLLSFSLIFEEFRMPPVSIWPFLIFFGLFAFGIPKLLWQIALNKIDLSKTTAIGLSYPAFSFVMAYFLLGEIPSLYQWLGLLLAFVGIGFLVKSNSRTLTNLE